jgi:hypothetical protein
MQINLLHEEELRQLTGCRYSVLILLKKALLLHFAGRRAGRPYKHSVWTMLIVTLIKMRGAEAYKTLEIYLHIDSVTLHRYVNRVCGLLADIPFGKGLDYQYLIVDGTCTRVRSTDEQNYSGYKHHKNRKVQMIVDDCRRVVAVSPCYSGAVHDKTIWNREFALTKSSIDKPILGDKGYAGGLGENKVLFRPIKRNELEYKNNKAETKAFNRLLSQKRVVVEHVFAQLKAFKLLCGIFPLKSHRYGTFFRAIAFVYNSNLDAKQRRK